MDQIMSLVSVAWETTTGYMGLDESMKTLETQVNQLSLQSKDVETMLMNLERGGKRKRKREVESWLKQVKEMINEFTTFNERTTHWGSLKKLKSVKCVKTMKEKVKELKDEGRNIGELIVDVDESRVYPLVVSQLSGRASNNNLEEIYGWLEDGNILSIGVYGMGGVGKTTLVKHIHNRILQRMPHCKVYWVTVSQDFSIKKLQADIAESANLVLPEENEERRAAILSNHLVGKNVVVILDDVWDNICLEKLGNPLGVEGCKLIITTRSLEVCHKIGCQKFFKVNVLDENEAWDLFKEILLHHDHTLLTGATEELAKSLAEKCHGLPLALITVAGSMRGVTDVHSWRHALTEFQNAPLQVENMENDVFRILQFSFNRLNDPTLRNCFLYCCLYPEDEEIYKYQLISKFIEEGFICGDTREAEFDQGHSILNKLVNICLLEEGPWIGRSIWVRMHDLIRDMAIRSSNFMVKSRLKKIPKEQHWFHELDKVSFMRNSIEEIPHYFSPKCHKLSTLIFRENWGLKRFPESFFSYMKQLRVLDLSYNHEIECLTSSISNLENLCALLLECCQSITFLPPLEKLTTLRVLNIKNTGIQELPQGMECLVSLQYLDMRGTEVKKIPKDIISKLIHLRCLLLEHLPCIQSEELDCLRHLEEFENSYDELHSFNGLVKNLVQLERYDIYVGDIDRYFFGMSCKRNVYFNEIRFGRERSQEFENFIQLDIDGLRIASCEGPNGYVADIFPSMSNLKFFVVCKCKEVQWIFNGKQKTENAINTSSAPFQSLEYLKLFKLPDLIGLCKGKNVSLPHHTFSFLKYLEICNCENIKKLLPLALLQNLKNLERLLVSTCYQLKEVIGVEDEEGNSDNPPLSSSNIYLPKLKTLSLWRLPELKSICNNREMICPSIEEILIDGCVKVKRMPSFLTIDETSGQPSPPSSLQKIIILTCEKGWWESLEWHNPNAKNILQSYIEWYPPPPSSSLFTLNFMKNLLWAPTCTRRR